MTIVDTANPRSAEREWDRLSYAMALRALIADRGLYDVIVVAHSMGTFVALAALDDYATRQYVRHLVLVNPITGGFSNGAINARLQGPLVRHGIAQRVANNRAVGRVMARVALHRTARDHVVERTRRSLAAIPPSATPMIDVLRTESVAGLLLAIPIPTTVLASSQDRTTPEWHARLIVRTMPHARLLYATDTGHMTPWEAP
jgi:pimeloyl-ACP methyl ester carboxylesterase